MSLTTQFNRAMAGFLKSRFLASRFDRIADPRRAASTRWPLRTLLHQLTRDAYRRKALAPDGLPFGVVALDGKVSAVGRVTWTAKPSTS